MIHQGGQELWSSKAKTLGPSMAQHETLELWKGVKEEVPTNSPMKPNQQPSEVRTYAWGHPRHGPRTCSMSRSVTKGQSSPSEDLGENTKLIEMLPHWRAEPAGLKRTKSELSIWFHVYTIRERSNGDEEYGQDLENEHICQLQELLRRKDEK